MDVDHRGIEKIGLFLFWLIDRRFVEGPRFGVLGRKNNPAAIRAEGNSALLSRSAGDSFSLALVDGGDVNITPNHEGKFFAIGAQDHFSDIVPETLDLCGSDAVAQSDLDADLLRLDGSSWEQVNLSIVPEAESAVACYGEKPDRIFLELGKLLGGSGLTVDQSQAPDVKGSALL